MLIVVSRFAALIVFAVIHATTNKVMAWVLPTGWDRFRLLLEALFAIAFGVIYTIQVFEMLAVFIPALDKLDAKMFRRDN